MKQKRKQIGGLLLCLIGLFFCSVVHAINPRLVWHTVHTNHFIIHYAEGYQQHAHRVAGIAEQAHDNLAPVINWQPIEKTHLVISDHTDYANGMATPVHFNRSVLFVTPPDSADGIEDFNDWMRTLIAHEYVHVLHLDKARGPVSGLRNIFGRQFLLFPNAYQPGWFIEGLATYYETEIDKDAGRGQSTFFKMMMQSEIEGGVKPVSQANLPIRSWPMGTVAYLYGVYFFQFLHDVYGEDASRRLIENYSGYVVPFMINTNTENVLGKDIEKLWSEYENWLEEHFARKEIFLDGLNISETGYMTDNINLDSRGGVYYIEKGPYEHAKLVKQDTEGDALKVNVNSSARIDVHASSRVLVTQLEVCDEFNIYYDIYILSEEKELDRITECGRHRSASWSKSGESIFATKLVKGKSWLVELDIEGSIKDVLWKGKDNDVIGQIKASPTENKLVASIFRKQLGWNIEEFDLETKRWKAITKDQYIDMYPVYSRDGKSILFSSEQSGRYQAYRFKSGETEIKQLTNVSTGVFAVAQINENSPLYYVGYHASGRDIYKLDDLSEINKKTEKSEANEIEQKNSEKVNGQDEEIEQVSISESNPYSAIDSMQPRWWLPVINFSEDRSEFGVLTAAHDALAVHNYNLNILYDSKNDWFAGGVSYSYANSFAIGYQREVDILRDAEGDFAIARKDEDYYISYAINFPAIEESLRYQFGILSSQLSDLKRAENIMPLADTRDHLLGAAAIYSTSQRYIRSISDTDGRKIRLLAETYEAVDNDFSGEVYTLDWREYFSVGRQSVVALRLVQAWGTDAAEVFRLGGEDNEIGLFDFLEPVGEPLFGRREYALRGYAEGQAELRGRRMQLASLEWRFPGELVERGWMAPPIGLIQWSGKVFTETGAAYNDDSAEEYYSAVGIELDADINLFYRLTSRMRLGYAKGLDETIGDSRIYFNLGASF